MSATMGEMQGWVSLLVSVLKLTAAQEVRYVHSLTVYGARAVNFYVTSAVKYYSARAVKNQERKQEPTTTE